MENNEVIPFEAIEIRSSKTEKGRYNIRGKAKIVPDKKYAYKFITDEKGNPVKSMKEIFSENAWDKIKKKIMSKQIFLDVNHKKIAQIRIDNTLNAMERETGKDLSSHREELHRWLKESDMPMFKWNDVKLSEDTMALDLDIDMNPYFRDIDKEHAAYFDATWNSLKDGFLNSLSLTMSPTNWKYNNEGIPLIDDIDVYGITLLGSPAHDDMYDCLDVAIRSSQTVIEKQEGGKNMTDEMKDTIKKELKNELNAEALKLENEKMKKEIEEKDNLLKAKEVSEREAEKKSLIDEQARLTAELEAKNKKLQEAPLGSRGMQPQTPSFYPSYEERKRVQEVLRPLEEGKKLGELIILQREFEGLKSLSPETQRLLRKNDGDIVAPRAS
ncbi:hypothetical protein M0R04_11155 [Candidatus Dojkabacteria bacterium]|jgi:hypothetical protein|nr:hypothetical protein [Candidatus Dojkabacteria bacterium]